MITVLFLAAAVLLRALGRPGNLDVRMGTMPLGGPGEDGDCDEHS